MTKKTNVYTYIGRGLSYSLTSISALFTGYLIQANHVFWLELLILAIPSIASIFFFLCYAACFPSPEYQTSDVELAIRDDAIYIYPVIAILIAVIIFLLTYFFGYPLSFWLVTAIIIQIGMYVFYGLFLWRHPSPTSIPFIRHQLVWSVILSIGISLYYGIIFSNLADSWEPLIPILLVLGLYFITKNLRERPFLVITLLCFLGSAVLAVLIKNRLIPISVELGEYFFTMQFCVIVSAYLAVLESWKITSDIAKKELSIIETGTPINVENVQQAKKNSGFDAPSNEQPVVNTDTDSNEISKKSFLYSTATLTALMISVWALPFFFIFSQYGTVFLMFFGIHASIAFVIWSYLGKGENLTNRNWGRYKFTAGLIFLIGLVLITSFFNTQPSGHFLKSIVSSIGFIGPILVAVIFLMKKFTTSYKNESGILVRIFAERVNFNRILSLFCLVACFILLILQDSFGEDSVIRYKSELALFFYGVCVVLCLIAELFHSIPFRPRLMIILNYINAFLILTRAITSFLISLAIVLPSIYTNRSFWASSLSALPFFLAATGGFSLNDYFDAEKDLINKPYRAIPSGILSRKFVLLFSIVSLVLAIITANFISLNNTEFILYLLCITGVTSYNLFVKYLSLSKTFLTSTVSALPILFSVIVYEYPKIYLLLPLATCSFILGREWLMDIRDIQGDSAEQIITVPMIIGSKTTTKFGFGFQFLAALLLLPIVIYNQSYWSTLLLVMITFSVVVLAPLWSYHSGVFQQWVVRLLWLPMLFGLLLFIR